MKEPVVVIGIGELGAVFARGLLRLGHPVYPITRDMDMAAEADALPTPLMVLLAVAEKDLHSTLSAIPEPWQDRLALLQNELLPRDWEAAELQQPTVISVWFEKKKGQDSKVLIPSPAFGTHAKLLRDALEGIGIATRVVSTADELLFELVRKNVYIVTTNIAGLVVGGNVAELWRDHESLARATALEVIDIQEQLTGKHFDNEALITGMLEAFDGDPQHGCMGRSAPARLRRALEQADSAGLAVPKLREIAKAHLPD
ncbi:MAG: hypothetical protein KKA36_04930 [Gammaproteobacteria bacterium]|nr:hypothetical protein [Gammaproteobacteria bacterium]